MAKNLLKTRLYVPTGVESILSKIPDFCSSDKLLMVIIGIINKAGSQKIWNKLFKQSTDSGD